MNESPEQFSGKVAKSETVSELGRSGAIVPQNYLKGVPSDRVCNNCRGSVWWVGDRMQCVSCGGNDYRMRLNLGTPPRKSLPQEVNPAWEKFGFRGQVAKLLYERGLKAKALRFANCNCLGRPGVCERYPFEHKYFVLHGCEVIFCRECAKAARLALFCAYLQVIRNAILDFAGERPEFESLIEAIAEGLEPKLRQEAEVKLSEVWSRVARHISEAGWVLARINFTLWSDGSEITPDGPKKMNAAVRFTMRKSVGKPKGFGMLFMDEVGFETRGHTRERKAGGLNLHAHGLYFGPLLDWEKTRDLWMDETNKRFGVSSRGFWIEKVRGLKTDPERTIRHALNHMLKYVSKPPAVTPGRLASLIGAFNGAKRIHSLGLFYGKKPKREKRGCLCPKCRAEGIVSSISFEGSPLSEGGCIPRLVPIDDLKKQGYQPLSGDGRTTNFGDVPIERLGSGPP